MQDIEIKTIEHKKQRYDTCGDYWTNKLGIHFRISKMQDERSEWLVLIHELVEKALCRHAGIDDTSIDAFDMQWEPHDDIDEPGCDPWAPYHQQHMLAMKIERTICKAMNLSWSNHDDNVMKLKWRGK